MAELVVPEFEHFFKMVLVGDSMVGKSSFLRQFRQGTFTLEHKPTESTDFALKVVQSENVSMKVQIWDTSDSLRYGRLTQSYFSNVLGMAQAVILMFDITDQKSYDNTDRWLETIMNLSSSEVIVGLVGSKKDLESQRQVETKAAEELAKGLGIQFFEVSSKSGESVDYVVNALAIKILANASREESAMARKSPSGLRVIAPSEKGSSIVNLNSASKKGHSDCCKQS